MEPMNRKWASSRVDLELFCIPELTLVFISSCDSVLGDSLVFHHKIEAPYISDWENGIVLHTIQGNQDSSLGEGDVSWDISKAGT